MESPSLTPAYVVGAITAIVGLFLTQGLIDNNTEKFVTGLASVLVPIAFVVAHAIYHGRVHAAKISSGEPVVKPSAPVVVPPVVKP